MPSIVIPEIYQPGLAVFLRLTDSQIDALLRGLESIPNGAHSRSDFSAAVSPAIPELDSKQVEHLIAAIYSLFELRALIDLSPEDFSRDLGSALNASGKSDLALTEPALSAVVANLTRLFAVKSLNLFAKANALQRTHEHIFHDARVLTDLRPVFSDPAETPQGMIIEHTLRIHYHDGSSHRELYMTLDAADLDRLRKAIDRAETKAATLARLLSAKEIEQLYLA